MIEATARNDSQGADADARRARLVRAAGRASVAAAIAIIVLKLVIWWQSGSTAVLASLVDSLTDLASSTINLFALMYAARPADNEHRYGHGKAEALAAFVQAIALIGSASMVIWHAGAALVGRDTSLVLSGAEMPLAVGGMVAVMVITAALVLFQRYVVAHTGSQLVLADSLHYRTDFLINGAVIVTLLLSSVAGWLDPVLAVLIGFYICWTAAAILRRAVNELLDRELPDPLDSEVLDIAGSHPLVRDVHGLRTRQAAGRYFVQFDLDFPPETTLETAHGAATEVRLRLQSRFPGMDVQIHFDPWHGAERGAGVPEQDRGALF